jgi:hypothetical protein
MEKPDIERAEDCLKRIQALAENPYWTADRRWKIAELAAQALSALRPVALVLLAATASAADRTPETVAKAALELLPRRTVVSLVDPDTQRNPAVREKIRNLEAFTLEGDRVVYLNVRGGTFRRASTTDDERTYRFDLHVLAAAIWHEMAHLDGADERAAQLAEEKIWSMFVRDGRVVQEDGMRQAMIYARRR